MNQTQNAYTNNNGYTASNLVQQQPIYVPPYAHSYTSYAANPYMTNYTTNNQIYNNLAYNANQIYNQYQNYNTAQLTVPQVLSLSFMKHLI